MNDISETAFFTAIREGKVELVRSLLDETPSLVDAKYSNGMSSLGLALGCGYLDIVDALLNHGANPNDDSARYYIDEYPDLLALFLQYGFNPDTLTDFPICKFTLVHTFANDYSIDKLELLISYGANIEARDNDGQTALHLTVNDSEFQSARMLIDNGADIEVVDNSGMTPLFYAAARGSIEMVDMLLEKGADPCRRNKDGYSVISFACMNDTSMHTTVENGIPTTRFTDTKPDIAILNRLIDLTGRDILTIFDAAAMDDIKKADELLQKDLSLLDARNSQGMRPLQYAAKFGNVNMIKYLLGKGACICMDDDEEPPIFLSVFSGSVEVAEILLDHGADDIDTTPLHEAVSKDNINLVRLFLAHGADPNAIDSDNNRPIHFAWSLECIKILLEAGADVNAKGYTGDTVFRMSDIPYLETVQILHSYGADINISNDRGETPINYAVTSKNGELLDALISIYGVDTLSIFDLASIGELDKLKARIAENPSLLHEVDEQKKNRSLLHYAAEANQLETAKYLVESGIEVDVRDSRGETPLYFAAESGKSNVLEYLLSKGADPNAKDNRWGYSPLHRASAADNIEGARILIEYGADINAKATEHGDTPMHLEESMEMIHLLMRAGGIY
ncbi:MAG: ankyrin repeat domain-containing protein [Armatimonadota bacterium]